MKPERIQTEDEEVIVQDPGTGMETAGPLAAQARPLAAELSAEIGDIRVTFQVFAPEAAVVI